MSSDESFLWTSVSNDNSNSDDGSTSHQLSNIKSELKHDGKYEKTRDKSINGIVSHNNCIKDEPASDVDSKFLKKEHNHTSDTDETVPFNDSYLNLRVKEEQLSCVDDSDIPIKKKKKKKRKHSLGELNGDNKFQDLENKQIKDEHKEKKNITIDVNVITESSATEDSRYTKHKRNQKKEKYTGEDCNVSNISEITCYNDNKLECTLEDNHADSNRLKSSQSVVNELEPRVRKQSKVSDRIQFEGDISELDLNKSKEFNKTVNEVICDQKQMRRYLKRNTNLQPISPKTNLDSIITDADDVWLLKCPQDVDIMNLKDVPLSLNNKRKLKLDGKVYDYMVDHNAMRFPLMTFHNVDKPLIKSITMKGSIVLKNRVPKVHLPANETMVNGQTNFIPLPDTKCRHPLFGIHYKKLVKVPKEIAKRLQQKDQVDSLALQDTKKEKKKKHKKHKRSSEVYDELPEQMKIEPEACMKKKKRKLSSDTNGPVKRKRVKYDPDTAQTWDSEQAIEENLFNF